MIRKIKGSLFWKVFFLVSVFLLSVCLLLFGLIAWLTPKTYLNELNTELDLKVKNFLTELEQTAFEDSGGLFDRFIYTNNIYRVELYSPDGEQMELPTREQSENTVYEGAVAVETTYVVAAPSWCGTYSFSFLGSSEKYTLAVYGDAAEVSELENSFVRIFPFVLGIILCVALFASWLFSRIVTLPVLKICRVAEDMSEMKLNWKIESGKKRTDELGILQKSLNVLSQKLQKTMDDLRNANTRLEEELEQEKALEKAQMDFFSAASHELKTPVTVIKGQLEGMLLGIGAYKDRDKYLKKALKTTNSLQEMVGELLTVSRLEISGKEQKQEYFDCIPVINEYLSETEDLTVEKELTVNFAAETPAPINGNRLLLEKVFSNLIGNAVRYSKRGAVIDIKAEKSDDGGFQFSVENSGAHIPEEAIPKLFDAFYRVDVSRNRQTGGSGLGLYIVRKILALHNSQCNVRNTEKGVEFFFELQKTN